MDLTIKIAYIYNELLDYNIYLLHRNENQISQYFEKTNKNV